jgi:TetR/AcrR family transcriptional regulator, regulator of cefoperazone and chloramphenicol sensitivity
MPKSTTDSRSRGDATREALLTTAAAVFGRDGFHAASTRAIAEAAGVPQGLIGYHFRSKEGLYVAVFEHVASQLRERLGPILDAVEAALATAETETGKDRLRARHLELLLRIVDGALALFVRDESAEWIQLVVREQREPTEAFAVFYAGFAERMFGLLARLVESIHEGCDAQEARLTVVSIMGQMLFFRTGRAGVLRLLGWSSIGEKELAIIRHHIRTTVTAQLLPGELGFDAGAV